MGSWLPFGGGLRMCIGYVFAMQEMKVSSFCSCCLRPCKPKNWQFCVSSVAVALRLSCRVHDVCLHQRRQDWNLWHHGQPFYAQQALTSELKVMMRLEASCQLTVLQIMAAVLARDYDWEIDFSEQIKPFPMPVPVRGLPLSFSKLSGSGLASSTSH